jgi:DNA-3-methyladenine glycosylase
MNKLEREFYSRSAVEVAMGLLGKYLVHRTGGRELVTKIVETEAYMGPEDKAAHSYNNRRTNRTEVMFGPPGHAYVFRIYGMYSCMNVVASEIGKPQAVLIRAAEPAEGLEQMSLLRYRKSLAECTKRDILNLSNGPGKLCQAMNITGSNNRDDLCSNRLFLLEDAPQEFHMVTTTRINIDYAEEAIHFPYRFYIYGNSYVSVRDKNYCLP